MTDIVDPFDFHPSGIVDPFDPAFKGKAPATPNVDTAAPLGSEGFLGGLADVGRGLAHGVISDLPQAVGQAATFFGAPQTGGAIQQFGKEQDQAHPELRKSVVGQVAAANDTSGLSLRGNAYEGGSNAPLSEGPGLAGAALGAGIGSIVPGVGTLAGAGLGYVAGKLASLPLFYGSQGQQSYEAIKEGQLKSGATPEAAETAARTGGHISGTIEAGGELLGDLIPFHAIAKPFVKPVEGALVRSTLSGSFKRALTNFAEMEAAENLTEMGQQAGEAQVEKAFGSGGEGATVKDTLSVVVPTTLMTLVPGLAAGVHTVRTVGAARQALANPDTPPEQRAAAAALVFENIKKANPDTASAFDRYAGLQIEQGKPIETDQNDAFYHKAVDAQPLSEAPPRVPQATPALPAPGPILATPTTDYAAQQAADTHAAFLYAARDAEEQRLRELGATAGLNPDAGPLQRAGTVALDSGAAAAAPIPENAENNRANSSPINGIPSAVTSQAPAEGVKSGEPAGPLASSLRSIPYVNQTAADLFAARRTRETGEPHVVQPHLEQPQRFGVYPQAALDARADSEKAGAEAVKAAEQVKADAQKAAEKARTTELKAAETAAETALQPAPEKPGVAAEPAPTAAETKIHVAALDDQIDTQQAHADTLRASGDAEDQTRADALDRDVDRLTTARDALGGEAKAGPSDDERLANKKSARAAFTAQGAPDDVADARILKAQDTANERGEPMTLWRGPSTGQLGWVPASNKSPFVNGEKIATIHPEESNASSDQGEKATQLHGADENVAAHPQAGKAEGPAAGGNAEGEVAPPATPPPYARPLRSFDTERAARAHAETVGAATREPQQVVPHPTMAGKFAVVPASVDQAANEAATSPSNEKPEPTPDQIEAGNYAKGHIKVGPLDISVENPEGSTRRSQPGVTPAWETKLARAHYGYIRGTVGADKDHIDAFVKPGTTAEHAGPVYVLDQANAVGGFDEHKVLLGYASKLEAIGAYKANYPKGHKVGPVHETTMEQFRSWVAAGKTKEPFGRFVQATKAAARADEKAQKEAAADKEAEAKRKAESEANRNRKNGTPWEKSRTFDLTLDSGDQVKVEYESPKTAISGSIGGAHFAFHGDAISPTGYRSDFVHYNTTDQYETPEAYAKAKAEALAVEQRKGKPPSPNALAAAKAKAKALKQAVRTAQLDLFNEAALGRTLHALDDTALRAELARIALGLPGSDDVLRAEALKHPDLITDKLLAAVRIASAKADAKAKKAEAEAAKKPPEPKKLANTGDDLRREWELVKAQLKAKNDAEGVTGMNRILAETTRADLFRDLPGEGATPGTQRYVEQVRDHVRTFKDWLFDKGPLEKLSFWDRMSGDEKLDQFIHGRKTLRYKDSWRGIVPDEALDTDGWDPSSVTVQERLDLLRNAADTYLAQTRVLTDALRGATTVKDAAELVTGRIWNAAADPKKMGRWNALSDENVTPAGKALRESGVIVPEEALMLHARGTRVEWLIHEEAKPDDPTARKTPLVPPRLLDTNRVGLPEVRKGDVTPKQLKDQFGFADIGFGSWVAAKEDQANLNLAWDSFSDLARYLGINPQAIGFFGKLHFTIGALGHGAKAAATFHPAHPGPNGIVQVINLTKTKGDGTVAHEWGHALDHFLSRTAEGRQAIADVVRALKTKYDFEQVRQAALRGLKGTSYMTSQKRATPVERAAGLVDYYASRGRGTSDYKQQADKLDPKYWGNDAELFARAWESWTYDNLGGANQYLVNPWVADGVTGPPTYRGTPFPRGEERKRFGTWMKALVSSVRTDGALAFDKVAFDANKPDDEQQWRDAVTNLKGELALMYEQLQAEEAAAKVEAAHWMSARGTGVEPAAGDRVRSGEREGVVQWVKGAEWRVKWDDGHELNYARNSNGAPPDLFLRDSAIAAKQAAAAEAREQEAQNPPAQTFPQDTVLSADDLEALFDAAADDVRAEAQENALAPEPGEPALNNSTEQAPPKHTPRAPASTTEKVQGETASKLIAEAASQGVKGIDEALKGLTKLFGGGKIQSFPGGMDEATYKEAKPHFEASLKAFQAAGKSLKDLFALLIRQLGEGIKPYAIRFAQEQKLTATLGEQPSATKQIAEWVRSQLDRPDATSTISSPALFQKANEAFGGTQADGKYTPKDAYDAAEAGINLWILAHPELGREGPRTALAILKRMTDKLPTQTKRTQEMDEFQQFSTVPALAYLSAWVANIHPGEQMLEPSAGIGGLAVFAHNGGAVVVANELSSRRAAVLREVLPDARVFTENAEQLDNVLPDDVKPTVIVMNPPFSATAGRVEGSRDNRNGARHIEQALGRLEAGGRLVVITGRGMGFGYPGMKDWWDGIKGQYNVRANLSLNGAEYAKYGTTFDNQLIVIDKTGPTTNDIVQGRVEAYADLPALLEGVRNDRHQPSRSDLAPERPTAEQGGGEAVAGGLDQFGGTPPADTGGVGSGERDQRGNGESGADHGNDRVGGPQSDAGGPATGHGPAVGKQPRRVRQPGRVDTAAGGADRAGSDSGSVDRTELTLDASGVERRDRELTDAIFETYVPQKAKVEGAKPHPGKLVESAAMASVEPVDVTYTPNLPKASITSGAVSAAQLEPIIYAGQAHAQELPNGDRRGFFIGDGTGVGKGREIAGILMDNQRQGRKKHLWISEKSGLFTDAKRDLEGAGGDPSHLFELSATNAKDDVKTKHGIMFTTYDTLRGGETREPGAGFKVGAAVDTGMPGAWSLVKIDVKKGTVTVARNGKESTVKTADVTSIDGKRNWMETVAAQKVKTRLDQIIDWVGPDFDGVLVFDEAHNMSNLGEQTGARGAKEASAKALAGLGLQNKLPKARVVYASATGATEVSNLMYAARLGLWGANTAFPTPSAFHTNISAAGLASMELVARDLKAQGSYIARSLSYDGVEYEKLDVPLSPLQTEIYDELAKGWQIVFQNLEAALKETNQVQNGRAKGNARGAFYSSVQRFFNQVITSMQTPAIIDRAQQALGEGKAVVFQLVNTNEATQERLLKTAEAEGTQLEDLDFSPRQMLIDYLMKAFPIQQFQLVTDDAGNLRSEPVKDAQGQPVISKKALAMRDALIKKMEDIRVPDNPIDLILQGLGEKNTAEVTGRKRRMVRALGRDGEYSLTEEKRGDAAAKVDARAFMDDKKHALIFSEKGGTGFSYHSDLGAKNQRQRVHFLVQPGWRADKAVQGLGRTHRSNEANQPLYILPQTNLKAQKRFISSIARRLDQLGALTKGQRNTSSQGLFTNRDNLESRYATAALHSLLQDLAPGSRAETTIENKAAVIQAMGFQELYDPRTGNLLDGAIPPVTQFLNRLLGLTVAQQDQVFGEFEQRMDAAIDHAQETGTFDDGMQTVKALAIKKLRDEPVYVDPRTQAATRYVELELTQATTLNAWEDAQNELATRAGKGISYHVDNQTGQPFAVIDLGSRVDAKGGLIHRGYRVNVTAPSLAQRGVYIQNLDSIRNGGGTRIFTQEGEGGGAWTDGRNEPDGKPTYIPAGPQKFEKRGTRYETIAEDTAHYLWGDAYDTAPKTRTEKLNLLAGVLLPVWDRIQSGDGTAAAVVRTQTDDGERFIGRVLTDEQRPQILKNFGVGAIAADTPAADLMARVLSGEAAQLSNGWLLRKVRVANEDRIEIKAAYLSPSEMKLLVSQGAFVERIGYTERVFIPRNADTFEAITRGANRPVVDFVGAPEARNARELDFGRVESPPPPRAQAVEGKIGGEPPRILRDLEDVRALTPKEENAVAFAIRSMLATGMPEAVMQGMPPMGVQPDTRPGSGDRAGDATYWPSEASITLRQGVMDAIANGDPVWAGRLPGLLAHEFGHRIDYQTDARVSSSERSALFNVTDIGNRRIPRGPIMAEAVRTFLDGDSQLRQLLRYPLAYWAHNIGDIAHQQMLQSEVFAQLWRAYHTAPALLAREMPKSYALMKEIRDGIHPGASLDDARQAVRRALRVTNPEERAGFGYADRAAGVGDSGGLASRNATEGLDGTSDGRVLDRFGQGVVDLLRAAKGPQQFNRILKPFMTQYHKAETNPYFKPVFVSAQAYLHDVSRFATDAANLAPRLLPRLDRFRDIFRRGEKRADVRAVGNAVFAATLGDVRPSEEELKAGMTIPVRYGDTIGAIDVAPLTEGQLKLYREARKAIDLSLDQVATSEASKLAAGEKIEAALKAAKDDPVNGARIIADALWARADALDQLKSFSEAVRARNVSKQVQELGDKAAELKAKGYAPLMRFGQYTVDVVQTVNGKPQRVYFSMFETKGEAFVMERQMKAAYPDAAVTVGTMNEEEYKLYQGLSLDSLSAFAETTGYSKDPLFQDFYKLALSSRSALKRMIHRNGIAGFDEDLQRVLASFVTSQGRLASKNYHFGEMTRAAAAIPAQYGDVGAEAVKLVSYVQNPVDEASKLRGLLFVNFLGGSVASALTNMTQPIMTTLPYLSRFTNPAVALKALTLGAKDAVSGGVPSDPALRDALDRASREGVTDPQELHQLYAESIRGLGRNLAVRKGLKVWGSLFSLAESFNRRVTFIAAFRLAQGMTTEQLGAAGVTNAFDFAEKAVDETQFIYCVDEETEALTKDGWKRHTALVPGETVYAVDEAGRLVESQLIDVHRFRGRLPATKLSNANGFSTVVTDEHACLVQNYNSRDRKWQRIKRVKAKDLKRSHHMLRVPLGDATDRPMIYTDDEVRLFAWVAAEGHLFAHRNCKVKRGVGLVQSESHNPHYVAEIDALLDRLGGHHSRSVSRTDRMVCWSLRKPLWLKMHEALPGKLLSPTLVSKLTIAQMRLFLETFVKGDGHIPDEGGPVISQKSRENLDALQAMAVLSGRTSSIGPVQSHGGCTLYLAKNSKRAFVKEMTQERVTLNLAWCPETEHGTWIARRNGRTFVTGNSRANRPNAGRGALGATVMTFKQFSISYLEFFSRLPPREKALAAALLVAAAGIQGAPGADNLEDILDTIGQLLGFNTNTKQALREWAARELGAFGTFLVEGVSSIPGVPLDVQGRLGVQNLIPGTGLFKRSETDKTQEVAQFFGPLGGVYQSAAQGYNALVAGYTAGAEQALAPAAIRSAMQGVDMWTSGEYKDFRGRKVINTTPTDAVLKTLGIQPSDVAQASLRAQDVRQDVAMVQTVETGIADKLARAALDNDDAARGKALIELQEWNQRNPSWPIVINPGQIRQRIQQALLERNVRQTKAAPKEVRGMVLQDLQ